ncbi:DUF2911 domain-containing protein [Chryseobacterium sp. T1]
MKKIVALGLLCAGLMINAQTKQDPTQLNFAKIDASPLDVVYYPVAAPMSKGVDPIAKVIYSRPQSKGRAIFGNLVKYNDVWRFGANESTEIKFFKPVKIDGKEIPAGSYSVYAIPNENEWIVILNSVTDVWGSYTYDAFKDVIRVKVPVKKLSTPVEYFSISFVQTDKGADMVAAWDTTQIALPISL